MSSIYGELIAQFAGSTVDYWNISGPDGETIGRRGLVVPPALSGAEGTIITPSALNYPGEVACPDRFGVITPTAMMTRNL